MTCYKIIYSQCMYITTGYKILRISVRINYYKYPSQRDIRFANRLTFRRAVISPGNYFISLLPSLERDYCKSFICRVFVLSCRESTITTFIQDVIDLSYMKFLHLCRAQDASGGNPTTLAACLISCTD